ncbi:phosphoribosylaminoimidazolesuccinocarboxamide synthase [Helicobacter felis]|uniref:phosphoribosylaminoimidazolesuccinocarboxamide synthase n=1 Tax=Helicobacter felis TaxID=214 RepID=UPI000CF0B44B|nr:phosphoribosylaminoimidazolesuccinocarboxamide synthase [Helicobacter felis]
MNIQKLLYEGKAKKVYSTDNPQHYIVEYKDEATAFNRAKKATLQGKGRLNNRISNTLMSYLNDHGVLTHLVQEMSPTQTLVKQLKMFPLEVIVRNRAAGSICKRLGFEEARAFAPPLVEFCYKNDALGDPFINDDHVRILNLATPEECATIKTLALKVNTLLEAYFQKLDIILVDFKLEFGKDAQGTIILGDEVSPDTCRFWHAQSGEKLDKDRFREDLGGVCEAYEMILNKISQG